MAQPIAEVLDPCQNVRRSCGRIMNLTNMVKIDDAKINELVINLFAQNQTSPTEWDAEGWHYRASIIQDEDERRERVALYILALDAINFCFWPTTDRKDEITIGDSNYLEYDHLALGLTALAKLDEEAGSRSYFFSPTNLSILDVGTMQKALDQHLDGHFLPNVAERCRLWNELGSSLQQNFNGSAMELIGAAQGWAPRLVQLLVQYFPGFRDESIFGGQFVCFYKRAQIAVGDLQAALQLDLEGMDQLTTFADYRVPQLLRHWNVLQYDESLAKKVDGRIDLSPNSEEEIAIRAATVVAVDMIAEKLEGLTAVTLDWRLWQLGEQMNKDGQLLPHHRVRTIFY